MRNLTDNEIQIISGSGAATYNLPAGATVTTTLMPNNSTTIKVELGGHSYSANSGQMLAKTLIGVGVGAMTLPFTGPLGAFVIGRAASYGAGLLMDSTSAQ